jgi:hypothetical protein
MPLCPQVLDAGELAARIGTTPQKVMDLHRRGLIPSIKTSHRVFFNLDQVVKALREREASRREMATC